MDLTNILATIVCMSGGEVFAYTGYTTTWSTDLNDAHYVLYPEARDIADKLNGLHADDSKRSYNVMVKTVTR